MGVVGDVAGLAGDVATGDFGVDDVLTGDADLSGPLEDSDTPVEAGGRYASGAVDYGESLLSGDREDFVLTGGLRTVYDTWADYDGSWGGQQDTVDVLGPGLWGSDGSVADVVVDRQGESHAGELSTKLLLVGGAVLTGLVLLAPYLGPVVDALVGGDG